MAISTLGTKIVNAGAIADLDTNIAIDGMALSYLTTAGDTLDVTVTDKQGVFVIASAAAEYSIDGGTTFVAFELETGTRQYLNVTVGLATVTIKSTVDATTVAVLKA